MRAGTSVTAHYCRQLAVSVFYICLSDFRHVLNAGFFKLLAFVALAFLLSFTLGRAAQLWKVVRLCRLGRATPPLPGTVNRHWLDRQSIVLGLPNEPILPPLIQRPPPVS